MEDTTNPLGMSDAEIGCAKRAGLLSLALASSWTAVEAKPRTARRAIEERDRRDEIIFRLRVVPSLTAKDE